MSDNLEHNSIPTLPPPRPVVFRAALAFGAYSLLMLLVLAGSEFVRIGALHPDTYFDFNNLLNINSIGVRWLLGIALLPVTWFIFFQAISHAVHGLQVPVTFRAGALLGAAFLTFFVGMLLPDSAQHNLAFIAGFALIATALFDFLTDENPPNFGWTASGLVLFAGFSAYLLYNYSTIRDTKLRTEYATALAAERDTELAEPLLIKLQQTIQSDAKLPFLLNPWPFKPSADTVRNHLNALAYQDPYLFQHYRLRVFAFDKAENAPLLLDQGEPRTILTEVWENATPLSSTTPEIRVAHARDGALRYILHARVNRMQDASHPADIYGYFDHVFPRQTQVYAQLFYNQPYKKLTRLPQYDFAVLRDGQLVAEQGHVNTAAYTAAVQNGATRAFDSDTHTDMIARSADGHTTAVVGRNATSESQVIYLFSILFTLSTTVLLFVGWLTSFLRRVTFLPTARGSLARRIQYAVFGLLAIGFLIVGWLTYRHFSQSAATADRAAFNQRAEAILTQLRATAIGIPTASDSLQRILSPALAQISSSLNIDANLFDSDGNLIYTTRDDLRRIGVLPLKMNTTARQALSKDQNSTATEETLNNRTFTSQYFSLPNGRNQTIGYLSVPYQFNTRGIGSEVSTFIGMLASIYVFLLLLGIAATYLLARSITRPVNQIADKIKEFQLQDKNLPLDYKGDQSDELGALVGAYNRMVDHMEDSKLLLVRLERESAWREMARQIAHDIKNPLTTMKLSMQQLERVSGNPEQAAAYLKRATSRLIEQIDSLAQTASEFSMFANLDMKNRAEVSLNDIVESVYDLFTEQKDADLSLSMPEDRYRIMADKNHLLRVFNNLVINAIQAIPSDRRGQVKVSLFHVGKTATVRISDNGGGIPVEIRDRVFEPNFTTKTTGSGLGLAICYKIIEAHDGTIRFETRDNEGTDFFVELPILG